MENDFRETTALLAQLLQPHCQDEEKLRGKPVLVTCLLMLQPSSHLKPSSHSGLASNKCDKQMMIKADYRPNYRLNRGYVAMCT